MEYSRDSSPHFQRTQCFASLWCDINQGERLLLFFSTFFLTLSLYLFSPPSLPNLFYFQTPPSVIISFPSFSPVSLPLFYYFCLPCHPSPLVISYLISLRCYYTTAPILTPSLRIPPPFSLLCLSLLNGSSDPIMEHRCCGAEEEEEEMEGGAGGGEDGRMDYVPWVWMGWLMNVASGGCYPCSGPAGTPLGHLWSHTHCADIHPHSSHKGKHTQKDTHTHASHTRHCWHYH